jgi:hypothetical protein
MKFEASNADKIFSHLKVGQKRILKTNSRFQCLDFVRQLRKVFY